MWVAFLCLLPVIFFVLKRATARADGAPSLPDFTPLLGHAASYGQNPVKFLLKCVARLGSVFSLNLAGNRIVIISKKGKALRSYFSADEATLSARAPVFDFGFGMALGPKAVHPGTDVLANLTRQHVQPNVESLSIDMYTSLREVFHKQIVPGKSGRLEVFPFMRILALEATIRNFLHPCFVENDPSFVSRFVHFQDNLEDAVGTSMIMPRWLAKRYLAPVERERDSIEKAILSALQKAHENREGMTPFLQGILDSAPSETEAASYILGFLFAAHKNPAIGAAQLLLFILNDSRIRERVEKELEGLREISDSKDRAVYLIKETPFLTLCVHEALRCTSHAIGSMRKVAVDEWKIEGCPFALKKGSLVGVSHKMTALDETDFPNPDEFNPSRFEGQNAASKTHDVIAFSGGVHMCPGKTIAIQEMKIFVAVLLAEGKVELEGKLPDLCYAKATLAQRKKPCFVSFEKM